MCGIFGWDLSKASNVSKSQRLILANSLSLLNDGRGGDSWGYYTPGKDLQKGLNLASPQAFGLAKNEIVMGHTRKATTGAKTVPNAHPFDIGTIIGAHNGMIHNHDELNKKYERKFEVDSMHIFAHLSEGKEFKELKGYGSIEYVLKDDPAQVLLCRMRNGDLSIAGIGTYENTQGIIWSSDKEHLDRAMKAAHLKGFEYEVKQDKVFAVIEGKLLETKIADLELGLGYNVVSTGPYAGWPEAEGDDMANEHYHWRNKGAGFHRHGNSVRATNKWGEIWALGSGHTMVWQGQRWVEDHEFIKEFPQSKVAGELLAKQAEKSKDVIAEKNEDWFPTQEEWEKMDDTEQLQFMDSCGLDKVDEIERLIETTDKKLLAAGGN